MTPTTVKIRWSSRTVFPTAAGSPPKRSRQSLSPRTATGGASGASSDAVSPRPSSGRVRKREKTLAVTVPADDQRRLALPGQREVVHADRAELIEGAGPAREVGVVGVGHAVARDALARQGLEDGGQPLRLGVGERLEKNRVDDREDRGVRADAQGQRRQGDRGESRALAQSPDRIANVLQQGIHGARREWLRRAARRVSRAACVEYPRAGPPMKKLLWALVVAGAAVLGYREYTGWRAYKAYEGFAEAWVHETLGRGGPVRRRGNRHTRF